jgi:hypothetical protein
MHILVIGGAGMVGRKFIERLARDGGLGGKAIDKVTAQDVFPASAPANAPFAFESLTSDLSQPGEAEKLIASRPELIFHLAAIVSGEAEADFDKGYRINLDGTRYLFDAIRLVGRRALQAARRLHLVDRRVRRAASRQDRGRVLHHAAHQLRHAEGDRRAAAQRLFAPRLLRRRRHPPADHLRAPGQAEQGRLRLLLQHPARAAERPGRGAAGLRPGAPLVRLARARPSASSLHAAEIDTNAIGSDRRGR